MNVLIFGDIGQLLLAHGYVAFRPGCRKWGRAGQWGQEQGGDWVHAIGPKT